MRMMSLFCGSYKLIVFGAFAHLLPFKCLLVPANSRTSVENPEHIRILCFSQSCLCWTRRHDFFLIWNWISDDLWILFPKSHKVAVNLSTRKLDTSNKKVNQIQKSLGLGPTSMTPSSKRFSDQRHKPFLFFAGPRKSLTLFVFSWCHDLFSSHLRAGSIEAKKG